MAMESSSPLHLAFLRLQKLFPTCLSEFPSVECWVGDSRQSASGFLPEAISRCHWAALDQRYGQRLTELRQENGAAFENSTEAIRIQCRAFHDAMDELDRARRDAVTRATRRRTSN
jgi:hypothetical protein